MKKVRMFYDIEHLFYECLDITDKLSELVNKNEKYKNSIYDKMHTYFDIMCNILRNMLDDYKGCRKHEVDCLLYRFEMATEELRELFME